VDASRSLAVGWWHLLDDFEREEVREWWKDHSLPFPRAEMVEQVKVSARDEARSITPAIEDFLRRWQPGWELAVDWWCSLTEQDRGQLLGPPPRTLVSDELMESLVRIGFEVEPPVSDLATSRYRLPNPVSDLLRWLSDT
jgi:hypothetical protein